jgi:hypothetical protein
MKYSDVVGDAFYRIGLSAKDAFLVNSYFSGACHHYFRWMETDRAGDLRAAAFHHARLMAHMRHLFSVVFTRGDFSRALDESYRDMDERDSWDPDAAIIPDPEMFDGLMADRRYPPGIDHEEDRHLTDLRPVVYRGRADREAKVLRYRGAANC